MKSLDKACPSATCETGAAVIGIVNQEGFVSLLPQKIDVTDEFVAIAHQGNTPEKRFRFTNKCVESGCRQWDGARCSVIDKVLHMNADFEIFAHLPTCSIRSNCRWYYQSGGKACAVCPFIITDNIVADEQERINMTETQVLVV
ncbi:hypothetical protein [Emticicia fontis]